MSDHELRDLRRELAACERGRGKRYPAALQERIKDWARREIGRGVSTRSAADAISLHSETLRKWLLDDAGAMALVPVEVVGDQPSTARFTVVSRAGFRVEGLALDEVVALLRVLG